MEHAFPYRGVMLDFARLTERHDYYRSLLPLLKEWGYNVLHLHLADDTGCAVRFPSHPGLATAHAFTADEMRSFRDDARGYGLEVVPEIECFGHTGFITRFSKYAHLREAPKGAKWNGSVCVFHPEAQRIIEGLLTDVVDIFEPRVIHAGLDEVDFGYNPASAALLRKRPKNELFADHVVWCHDVVAGLGSRMAMWGDHLLHDAEGVIAGRTPRDTLIFDWHYYTDYEPSTMDFFTRRGFEVWGAPSIQRYGNIILSSDENFANLRQFSSWALERRGVTGMVATAWCPWRYVPGTIVYPMALAGRIFSCGGLEPDGFAERFAQDFWGLKGARAREAGHAVRTLYSLAPDRHLYWRIVYGVHPGSRTKMFTQEERRLSRERLAVVADARRTLARAIPAAARNADRLRDMVVGAQYLETVYRFGAAGRKRDPGWGRLLASMRRAWARTRHCGGVHYTRKAPTPPAPRDVDEIMRHVNRLAIHT